MPNEGNPSIGGGQTDSGLKIDQSGDRAEKVYYTTLQGLSDRALRESMHHVAMVARGAARLMWHLDAGEVARVARWATDLEDALHHEQERRARGTSGEEPLPEEGSPPL